MANTWNPIDDTITAANDAHTVATTNVSAVGVVVTGTWTGTLVAEGTVDQSTWVALSMYNVASGATVTSLTGNATVQVLTTAGMVLTRIRASAWTSGTATVTISRATGTMTGTANIWTGSNTFTSPILLSNGTASAPAVAFSGDTDTGIYFVGSNQLGVTSGTALRFGIGADGGLAVGVNRNLAFASGATLNTEDVFLGREGAAILQLGKDVNGGAVAQTLKAHDGITGTDVAGANLTLAGGRGTGAGAGGNVILQAASALATGTTAQTLRDRQVIVGSAKALTAASATTFVTIGVASGGFAGGFIDYAIVASDGTDHQCRAGILPFAIVNKANTETGTVGTVGAATEVVAESTGASTLTNTFTIVAGTNAMDIKANAASSLVETTLDIYYQVHVNGPATVTPA